MNRIRELRKKAGLTQEKAAEALALPKSTYAGYETGIRKPDCNTLIKIADFYQIPLDYLLCRDIQENGCITAEELCLLKKYKKSNPIVQRIIKNILDMDFPSVKFEMTASVHPTKKIPVRLASRDGATVRQEYRTEEQLQELEQLEDLEDL